MCTLDCVCVECAVSVVAAWLRPRGGFQGCAFLCSRAAGIDPARV